MDTVRSGTGVLMGDEVQGLGQERGGTPRLVGRWGRSQVGNTCVDAPLAEEAAFREAGGPYDLPDHVHFSHSPERVKTVTTL